MQCKSQQSNRTMMLDVIVARNINFQVIWRWWRISLRNDCRNSKPGEMKESHQDYLDDSQLQSKPFLFLNCFAITNKQNVSTKAPGFSEAVNQDRIWLEGDQHGFKGHKLPSSWVPGMWAITSILSQVGDVVKGYLNKSDVLPLQHLSRGGALSEMLALLSASCFPPYSRLDMQDMLLLLVYIVILWGYVWCIRLTLKYIPITNMLLVLASTQARSG